MAGELLTRAWRALLGPSMPSNTGPAILLVSESDFHRLMDEQREQETTVAHRQAIGYPRNPQRSTTKRAYYGNYGCTVFGWPSTGGVILRADCDLVELTYLGLDPLNVPASRYVDQASEDEFCVALRKIGGRWWRSEQRWLDVTLANWTIDTEPTEEELRATFIGWPEEGGILVLEDEEPFIPGEVGMLRMVSSMEDRCRLLRDRLGAVYYENPRTYRGFSFLGPCPDKTREAIFGKTTQEKEYEEKKSTSESQTCISICNYLEKE